MREGEWRRLVVPAELAYGDRGLTKGSRGEKLRVRMISNDDGTYTVGYKPYTSGRYEIDVRLHGEPLPGSSFECIVSTLTPSVAMSTVSGAGLTSAVAREQQSFEVQFRDHLGQISHAEELEVYVEQVEGDSDGPDSPGRRTGFLDKTELAKKLRGVSLFDALTEAHLRFFKAKCAHPTLRNRARFDMLENRHSATVEFAVCVCF